MQLSTIPGGQQVAGAWTKGVELVQASLGAATGSTPAQSSANGDSTLKKIVAQYDLSRVSPREFAEMVDRLQQSGALSDADFQDLAGIRLELDKADYSPDETVNLVEILQSRVASLGSEASGSYSPQTLATAQRQLAWVSQHCAQATGQGSLLDVTV